MDCKPKPLRAWRKPQVVQRIGCNHYLEQIQQFIRRICGKRSRRLLESIPRRGYIQQPRVSAAQPWVTGTPSPNPERVSQRPVLSTRVGSYGIEKDRDVGFVEPLQGSESPWHPTQGCAALTVGCWMKPLWGTDRRSPERKDGKTAYPCTSEDAEPVLTRSYLPKVSFFRDSCSRLRAPLSFADMRPKRLARHHI